MPRCICLLRIESGTNCAPEFVDRPGHLIGPGGRQTLSPMVSPTDADRSQPRRLSHLHIKGRIANKNRILGFYSGRRKRLKKHGRVRLGGRGVRRLYGPEKLVPS